MGNKTGMLAAAIGLVLMSATVAAQTRYVSDELSINMRRGPGTSYGITELLSAGTPVETLDQTNGWTQIRTPEGETGYVLTRFLSDTPAARDRIADIESQLEQLTSENEALRAELAAALEGSSELGQLKRELVAENEALKAELARIKKISADAVRISQKNQEFRERLLAMQSELERLRAENRSLQSRREGMKIGALILVGGIILGLLLPMFRRRRSKSSWDSL